MHRSFYLRPPSMPFCDAASGYGESKYVIVGVPYDSTSSGRPGSRFAPLRIREVTEDLETFDPESMLEFEELPVHDAGNVILSSPEATLRRIEAVIREIVLDGKIPILLGGEHTITLPAVKATLSRYTDLAVVVFDAHLDLRNEYPEGVTVSHATVMRRIHELFNGRIVVVGARAFSKEEYLYALRNGITLAGPLDDLSRLIGETCALYVSVDIDVLDPSVAPGVSCPEPGGLSYSTLEQSLYTLLREFHDRIAVIDLVEVNPLCDVNDITSVCAAKLIIRMLTRHYAFSLK